MRLDDKEEEPKKGGHFVIRLPFSSLAVILFLFGAALSLAYVGGVMSGRRSQERPPEEVTENKAPPSKEERGEQRVIAAEDLEFARVLRGEKPRPPKTAPKEPEPRAETPEPRESESAAPAKEPETANAPAVAEDAPKTDAPAPLARPDGLTDYVFQMGAFKDDEGADNLREKLEGYGLRTRLRKDGKMRVVLALLRGSPERAEEVFRIARELKLGEPIIRERKPAP